MSGWVVLGIVVFLVFVLIGCIPVGGMRGITKTRSPYN